MNVSVPEGPTEGEVGNSKRAKAGTTKQELLDKVKQLEGKSNNITSAPRVNME
jgi:hypothetical protein